MSTLLFLLRMALLVILIAACAFGGTMLMLAGIGVATK